MVIFLRVAEKWRCVCGPVGGRVLASETMLFISSASFDASLYSRIHDSERDAIPAARQKKKLIYENW